jgi:hypothetical protein
LLGRSSGRYQFHVLCGQRFAADAPITAFHFVDNNPGDGTQALAFDFNHGFRQALDDSPLLSGCEHPFDQPYIYQWHLISPETVVFEPQAIAVLEQAAAGVELAWAYSHKSQLEMLASQMEAAVHWGTRALALAERLCDVEIMIHALGNIGSAKADIERSGSCTELERSFELALAGNFHDHVERASCNLTCTHYIRRDFPSSLGYIERGVALCGGPGADALGRLFARLARHDPPGSRRLDGCGG